MIKTIYWEDDSVMILDQRHLPHEFDYVKCTEYGMVAECIKRMSIRGAPAIGIAASMGVALAALRSGADSYEALMADIKTASSELLCTRPTAVNLKWALDRMNRFAESAKAYPAGVIKGMLKEESQRVLAEDIEANKAIGEWGAKFIKKGSRVLTHCNAGGLATGGYGTATAPMFVAKERGIEFSVYADETRPLLQGARLTAWEMVQSGIPVTLITDNSAGALMKMGEIDLAIVGTDRTARNGDVANKIGTYTVAVLCREHGIPLYVAAPLSSIDFSMASGDLIPIEERAPEEVTIVSEKLKIAPSGVGVRNLAFDVTPAKYITAIITEIGAFKPEDLHKINLPGSDLNALRV